MEAPGHGGNAVTEWDLSFASCLLVRQLRVVKGGSRSRFTENKTVLSQFTKNKIGISRFTEKKEKVLKLHTVTF